MAANPERCASFAAILYTTRKSCTKFQPKRCPTLTAMVKPPTKLFGPDSTEAPCSSVAQREPRGQLEDPLAHLRHSIRVLQVEQHLADHVRDSRHFCFAMRVWSPPRAEADAAGLEG